MQIEISKLAKRSRNFTEPARYKLLIAVPFYKNEALVATVMGSLLACADDLNQLQAEIVLFDDSPGYPPLQEALEAILPDAQAAFACRLERNEVNLGFVGTMNRAIAMAVSGHLDLLLLNSDTIVHPGAFPEMLRVASLDPMIGFVNPRSDNATLATIPVAHRLGEERREFDAAPYTAFAARLPELSYVPTAVGFCMLIRWHIIAEFGGFDPIYGAGYNEENDLVMRAGRCGYRAALANRAFVRHQSEASFSIAEVSKTTMEAVNRAILDHRYPEYGRCVSAHSEAPETRAERLLSALVPDADGRLDLAFDFSSFAKQHNGTSNSGNQLLQAACLAWRDRFNLFVLCSAESYAFHGYAELGVQRSDPAGDELFAIIFRHGQPFDWTVLQRMVSKGAVIGTYMLDTISMDCTQLTSQVLIDVWDFAFRHSDFFVTPSVQSMQQIELRFLIPQRTLRMHSLLSLDLGDYLHGAYAPKPQPGNQLLLVFGNHFPHKYLVPTANALAASFRERTVVALGQTKSRIETPFNPYGLPELSDAVNLAGIDVGHLSEAEIADFLGQADTVIFPTHYEGFGIPVLEALAAKRPVFVRRLPVFEELWKGQDFNPNIYFYETTQELVESLRQIPRWQELSAAPSDQGAPRGAREIRGLLEAALLQADYRSIVGRIRALPSHATPIAPSAAPVRQNVVDNAALLCASRVEWVARRVFRVRPLYIFSRALFRLVRPAAHIVTRYRRAL